MDNFKRYSLHFVALWFVFCIFTFTTSFLTLIYISRENVVTPSSQNFRLYAALPSSSVETVDEIVRKDARSVIVENFFKSYKSPLAEYSDLFIKIAEEQNLDYRLLPAISMQESNGGKRVIKDSHNPFGYGIYGNKVTKFPSWEEAIKVVGKALRENYLNEGLTTPNSIMTKYTPPSAAKDGAWAKGVSSFMSELK